jgi:hypothetical protein
LNRHRCRRVEPREAVMVGPNETVVATGALRKARPSSPVPSSDISSLASAGLTFPAAVSIRPSGPSQSAKARSWPETLLHPAAAVSSSGAGSFTGS